MPKALYGTPYFLTIQERDQVLDADLTDDAELAEYRDMFVCFSVWSDAVIVIL